MTIEDLAEIMGEAQVPPSKPRKRPVRRLLGWSRAREYASFEECVEVLRMCVTKEYGPLADEDSYYWPFDLCVTLLPTEHPREQGLRRRPLPRPRTREQQVMWRTALSMAYASRRSEGWSHERALAWTEEWLPRLLAS